MNKILELLKNNRNSIIKPTVVLLVICMVIPAALALTNKVTAEKIAALDAENSKKSMQQLVSADDYELKETPAFSYYAAVKGGEITAYIFTTSEKGYGGAVTVMTAVSDKGAVLGVSILDVSNETPGLGQNAAKESFYGQFKGKEPGISILKNGADSEKNEIDAVTGATITSTAVTRAVNKALENYSRAELCSPEVASNEK